MCRYAKYCRFRLLQFNIYFLGKYMNENLIFYKDFFNKKSFCYEDLEDFIKYSHILSVKFESEIDIYSIFYPYWHYIMSNINDFSFKYIWILFNSYMYPYEQKVVKEKLNLILRFCFQLNNKYVNDKKIKFLTILGIKIPLKFVHPRKP